MPEYASYGMMGAALFGLIVILWWLLFSRARWYERLGAIVVMILVGASFFLLPVAGISQRLGWWVPWENEGSIVFSPAWLDTPGGWVLCVVFGVVVLTTLLHAARVVVSVHARTAKTLLVAQGV